MIKKVLIKKSIVIPDVGQVYIRGCLDENDNPIIEFSRPVPLGFKKNYLQLSKKEFERFYQVFQKLDEAINN